ncbi:MAG: hypothetical protein ACREX4_00480 [Gammaproteobacteria bacterium]
MNREKDRWQRCYWQEWAAIKKRWDKAHTAWHELAEDSARRNDVRPFGGSPQRRRAERATGPIVYLVKRTVWTNHQ